MVLVLCLPRDVVVILVTHRAFVLGDRRPLTPHIWYGQEEVKACGGFRKLGDGMCGERHRGRLVNAVLTKCRSGLCMDRYTAGQA